MAGFVKAKRSQAKLRLALTGVSGGGKTFSALSLAKYLGKKVALIDTERSSASLYAGEFDFDTLNLDNFHPQNYIDAVNLAASGGYDVCIIDSLSHAWAGTGGTLELADAASKRTGANRFSAWKDVTPIQNKLIDSIISAPMHMIVTMRSKTEYVVEKDEKGRSIPRKIGLAPIQRDQMEFEFTVFGEMDQDNNLIISKTRCSALAGKVYHKPGKDIAEVLISWLSDGDPEQPKQPEVTNVARKASHEVDTTTQVPTVAASNNWVESIGNAKSLSELDSLLPGIKQLPPDQQAPLVPVFRDKKKVLQAVKA